jgi:hypothetical protein
MIPLYSHITAKAIPMRAPAQDQFSTVAYRLHSSLAAEINMKNDPRVPERKDIEDREFPCRACGEKFNSLAEAEQHEKDCRNRETSGAKPAEPE